jgi:hypothetical protein
VERVERALVPLRLGFAAAGVAAIAYQAGALATAHVFSAGNFFGFFTIQSNVLAAAVLAATAVLRPASRPPLFDAVRTGVTLYIAITGVVFAVLLSGSQESLDTHVAWVNLVVHTVQPIVLVVDWLVDPPRHRCSYTTAAAWLAYPVAWFAYTLARGVSTGFYPYPFVDVFEHGYPRVFANALVLLVCFAVAALAFGAVGNLRVAESRSRGDRT